MMRTLLAAALFMMMLNARAEAETIFIHSGPDQGEIRVSTPWGDYVAIDEGGGAVWVGTQREYDRARAIGIMQGSGFRLSSLPAAPGVTAEFVEEGSLRTNVGSIALDEIVPAVEFSGKVAGPNASAYQQVSVTWIQRSSVVVTCLFFNARTRQALTSGNSEDISDEWRNMVFSMPKSWLKRPIAIVFLAPRHAPGVILIDSFLWATYRYEVARVASFSSEGMEHARDDAIIQKLLHLDPALAGQYKAVATRPRAANAETPSPPAATPSIVPASVAAKPSASAFDYSGAISDTAAGAGTLQLHFRGDGNGTWNATFSNPALSDHGQILPASWDTFYLMSSGGCPYLVRFKQSENGALSGTYRGLECSNGGTFSVAPSVPAATPSTGTLTPPR